MLTYKGRHLITPMHNFNTNIIDANAYLGKLHNCRPHFLDGSPCFILRVGSYFHNDMLLVTFLMIYGLRKSNGRISSYKFYNIGAHGNP